MREAQDLSPALSSIARGLSELYGWRYVSIVASDAPGGEMYRRVVIGFPEDQIARRLGEHIPREAIGQLLQREYEVVPQCFYIPAEREQFWAYNIDSTSAPAPARINSGAWHQHDSLTMVLPDRGGEMLGYISVDGPLDGRVPSRETLRQMQLFVNLLGLALGNARGIAAEVERRRLLEQTSRAQSDFFSMVAHEVRSPLAAIRGATALLETHFASLSTERRNEVLHVLSTSTTRLGSIFEDFLLLSRMDAGKLRLRLEAVDPIQLIDESVARVQSEHVDRVFRTFYLAPIPRVYADEGRVVQIATNMLSNAAKYSTPGSVIAIEIRAHRERVRFAVKNEGPGIKEQDRSKIFTRFGRAGVESDNSIGLGLYICSQLVAMMGGTIGFDSNPGEITTFWFTLPRARDEASSA